MNTLKKHMNRIIIFVYITVKHFNNNTPIKLSY